MYRVKIVLYNTGIQKRIQGYSREYSFKIDIIEGYSREYMVTVENTRILLRIQGYSREYSNTVENTGIQ